MAYICQTCPPSGIFRASSNAPSLHSPGGTFGKIIRSPTPRPITFVTPLSMRPLVGCCDVFVMLNRPCQVDSHLTTTTATLEGSPFREGDLILSMAVQPLRKRLLANRRMADPHRAGTGGVAGGGGRGFLFFLPWFWCLFFLGG